MIKKWHDDEYDEIDRIFDQAVLGGTPFPAVCPCCGSASGHVYMNKHKECHGGIWTWCSECKASCHMDGWIPVWWKDAPFVDENLLCGETDYLDSMSREIDEWVNKLLISEEAVLIHNRLEEDKENVVCEMCGTEMIPFNEGLSCGMTCPKCSWGWVTTRFDPIHADTTDYRIILQPGNPVRRETIRAVSDIANVNYIQAKKMIETAPVTVFEGEACDIVTAVAELKAQNLIHVIHPDFPYDTD